MKLVCLNFDSCNHTQYLKDQELNQYIDHKFHTCDQCSYIMILVQDDYFIENNQKLFLDTIHFIKGINFD